MRTLAATLGVVCGLGLGACDDPGSEDSDADVVADAVCDTLPGGCQGTGKFDGIDFREVVRSLVFGKLGICPHDDRIEQMHEVDDDGLMTIVTDVRIDADLSATLGALGTPWTNWWRFSRAKDYEFSADGSSFTFYPIGIPLVTVDIDQGPPKEGLVDPTTGQAWDAGFEVALSGGFTGSMLLLVNETEGGVVLREVWDRVALTGPLANLDLRVVPIEEIGARLHGWTARGCMVPPGTGYPGLIDLLEAGQTDDDDGLHGDRIVGDHATADDGLLQVTTSTRLDPGVGSAEILDALVVTDWTQWWRHGIVTDRRETHDSAGQLSEVRFGLSPVSYVQEEFDWSVAPINVDVVMQAPVRESAEGAPEQWRVDVQLSGDFEGGAHFDVVETNNGFVVSSVWDSITTTRCGAGSADPGAGTATKLCRRTFAFLHSLAERGLMPGPLRGSGFPGLVDFLEP